MTPGERRVFAAQALAVTLVLAAAGLALRAWVARTLASEHRVHLAFLDLSLRDRSRFLGDTLSDQWDRDRAWPANLADVLTRNHADYNRDIFMQVFGMRGDRIAESANTPPDTELAPGARPEQGWKTHDSRTADGRPVRLVTYPIYTGLGTDAGITFHGYAQAGLLLPDTARQVARFTALLAAGLAAFGLGALAFLRASAARLARETLRVRDAQQRFVADAAHELGTPLAVLKGEIELALRRERGADEYRAALASCREEIDHLASLSENLLSLASADAGQPLVHPGPCDVAGVARRVGERLRPAAEAKGVRLAVEAPETLPWHADADALHRVLANLAGNAIRHTPAGETVVIRAARDGAALLLAVEDHGEGIPAALLPRVFDRFFRVDKARSRAAGGAGLGLAIVKTLVEAHGGTVTATSALGHGSRFACHLPLRAEAARAGQTPAQIS